MDVTHLLIVAIAEANRRSILAKSYTRELVLSACTFYCTVYMYFLLYCLHVLSTVLSTCTFYCTVYMYFLLYCLHVLSTVLSTCTFYCTVYMYFLLYCLHVLSTVLSTCTFYYAFQLLPQVRVKCSTVKRAIKYQFKFK